MKISKKYELGYKRHGENYQRKYPNEELCRFIGRRFGNLKRSKKQKIRILEVGCGPGGNLWMLAFEGFKTYGLDISLTSIQLAKKNLKSKKLKANLQVSDMINLNYRNDYFDVIIDVFSSCHLNQNEGDLFLQKVSSKLKKGGIFFSYFPSKRSLMFSSKYKKLIDKNTISKILAKNQIYSNAVMPMRFLYMSEYINLLKKYKFSLIYNETLIKSYKEGKDNFVFNIIEALKKY